MLYIQVIFFLLLFIWVVYLYSKLHRTRREGVHKDSPTLTMQGLLEHAAELSKKHEIQSGRNSINFLLSRMEENYKYIATAYKRLGLRVNRKQRIPDAAEWLLDNFYIIEKQTKELRLSIQRKYFRRLPIIKSGAYRGYPRVFALVHELINHSDSVVEQEILIDFISEYQKLLKLVDAEIWSLETMLKLALLQNIRRICERIMQTQSQYDNAETVALALYNVRDDKTKLKEIINEHLRNFDVNRSNFFEALVKILRKLGDCRLIFSALDERLSSLNMSPDEIVQIEHQKQAVCHISLGNAVTSLRFILNLDFTEIFEKLSVVEQLLQGDPIGTYPKMDKMSKNYYRRLVERIALSHSVSEVEVAKCAVSLAREYEGANEKKKHVGYYLINQELNLVKEPSVSFKSAWYITGISIATILFSGAFGWLAKLMFANVWFAIATFLVTLVPMSDIIINILNYIITRGVKASLIPKLELADGIPENGKTLVVISSLLTSSKDAKILAEKLEIYRAANNDKNLYFGILSDFPDSFDELCETDELALSAMEREIVALNKKHGNFYLFHRKRSYSARDKKYMGYERKRGALCELNSYLAHGNAGTFCSILGNKTQLAGIKYVITLDGDTRLPLGVARKLVGAMLHPLNSPRIDEEKRRVVDGYGLLQPKISMDLNASNRSGFSKIFAGQGGIDGYSNATSDVYQDLFGEGIYTGKGIYDVAVFDKVMSDLIPENAVLSHDLLEGCYVRCGLVSDVAFIDGFPWRYNSYAARSHRWIRGDWQLFRWLFWRHKNTKSKRVKNTLSAISRWKIFDNLRRSVLDAALLALIVATFFMQSNFAAWWLILPLVAINSSLLISTVEWFATGGYKYSGVMYHSTIIFGFKGILYQLGVMLMFLPYSAYLSVDAIVRVVFRSLLSKRKMLEWTTAEQSERINKNGIPSYYAKMWFNVAAGLSLIFFAQTMVIFAYILGLLWVFAPLVANLISSPVKISKPNISSDDKAFLLDNARRMWQYFEDFVTKQDNYLPPDNYQENPPNGVARRTSPTNIGMYLVSALAAYDLGIISVETMLDKLEKTIVTINKLEKWNGHLYNWYNTKDLSLLRPRYISTVDNGNYIVYLMTLKEGLLPLRADNNGEIKRRLDKIIMFLSDTISGTKFDLLYDKKRKLFTIGYNCEDEKLTKSYYDLLGSEARQVSYIAIANGEIDREHWFTLGRTLTTSDKFRGLVSWTGTMFEYLMPLLVMKNLPNTLLDETYQFILYCQKKYGKQRRVPWGTSESGFNAFDINLNYQYKAFGVPELGLKRGLVTDMVVAPYASLMALQVNANVALENLRRLEKMGLFGKYGFFEAVDFTPERVPYNSNFGVVQSFMAHHIGMSLLAVNNVLNDNIMQRRFHENINVKAAEELLEERIPTRVIITKDNKEEVLPLEPIESDFDEVERSIEEIDFDNPQVHVLSNGRFSTLITDNGLGFSRFLGNNVTRFRYDAINSNYGNFIYISDVNSGNVWSAAPAPMFENNRLYKTVFKPHMAEFFRAGEIETHTEVVVSAECDCEIRNVNITNRSNDDMIVDVTSYCEVTLTTHASDVAHPAFSNLFVRTEFDKERNAIIASRRPRCENSDEIFAAHAVTAECEILGDVEFETDRVKFIGRNQTVANPAANIFGMSKTVGAVLDSCFALRVRVKIEAGQTARIAFSTTVASSRSDVITSIERCQMPGAVGRTIELAHMRSKTENKYLGFPAKEQENYLKMLPHLTLPTREREKLEKFIIANTLGRESLWRFGISGDNPIITLVIEGKNLDVLRQALNAHEFFRIKGIAVDLVVISETDGSYIQPVSTAAYEIVSVSHARELVNIPGGVFLLNTKNLSENERNLLFASSSILLNDKEKDIKKQL